MQQAVSHSADHSKPISLKQSIYQRILQAKLAKRQSLASSRNPSPALTHRTNRSPARLSSQSSQRSTPSKAKIQRPSIQNIVVRFKQIKEQQFPAALFNFQSNALLKVSKPVLIKKVSFQNQALDRQQRAVLGKVLSSNIYQRNYLWQASRKEKVKRLQNQQQAKSKKQCTFSPVINRSSSIKKQICPKQTNEVKYAKRRVL